MHEEQDMRRMGGLRKYMPVTAATFIVGWLAIAGVPPFAGFWSKDEILAFAFNDSVALWAIGLLTALLTAFYMSRQVFMVFFGEPRWKGEQAPAGGEAQASAEEVDDHRAGGAHAEGDAEEIHPHESPWIMLTPLVVLAVLATVGGALNLPFDEDLKFLEHWLHPVVEVGEAELTLSGATQFTLAALTVLLDVVAIGAAFLVYLRRRVPAERVEKPVLVHAWYYDEAITDFMGGPGRRSFDGIAAFDAAVVDGAVNGTATVVRGVGGRLRRLQTGYVRNYALGIAVGTVIIVGLFIVQGL
jgi:NADH-quinone oxidoreductase subunit L